VAADTQNTIVEISTAPKVGDLITEFKRNGSQGDQFGRMMRAEDVRLARWDGQSEDGKKHAKDLPDGEEVFPWEGASDVRSYHADMACNETVAMLYMAFWSAILKIAPGTPNDMSDSATATEFLDWMVHFQLHRQLDIEVELAAQFMQSLGAVGLHVTWEREVGRKLVTVKLDDLLQMSQQAQQLSVIGNQTGQIPPDQEQMIQVLQVLPELIADPTVEDEAVKAIQFVYDEYARRQLPADLQEEDIHLLSLGRARTAVKQLRTDRQCDLPMAYLCKNQPKISALKPYRDMIIPVETGAIEDAPVCFVRALFTEANLRKMALARDPWQPDWIEEAVKTKGKFSTWQLNNPYSQYGTWSWRAVDNRSWLIEVVYAYYKQVDADGVTQIQYTVFSPHLPSKPGQASDAQDFAGVSAILNNPRAEYPIILGRRERFDRSWLATRGLCEIFQTDQNVEKAMVDGIVDLASISTVPPMQIPKGMTTRPKIGPAVQNEYTPGRESKFMEMPLANAQPAMEVIAGIRAKMARYCGLFDETVPPQLSVVMQQPVVKKFLIMWGEALQMAYELSVKFAPETIEAVTGTAPNPDSEQFHYVMHFDVTQNQPELMEAKLKALNEEAATDVTGTIDRAALKAMNVTMIDPAIAKQIIIGKGQASIALKKEVMNDLVNMFAGSEAVYSDASNDPAAPTKLQMAQEVLQGNPNYLTSLDPKLADELFGPGSGQKLMQMQGQNGGGQKNPRFSMLLENYMKNLKQGVDQQQNKTVGRTGVKQLTQ
jgi:hypothetical protein